MLKQVPQLGKKARVYDGTAWQELASAQTDLTAYSTTAQTTSGFRNAIINGDFRINQRAFTTNTTDNAYMFDRWQAALTSGATWTAQTFTLGTAPVIGYEAANFIRVVTTGQSGSGVFTQTRQRIEDVRSFANQTITVSFWAKTNSGTPKVAIELDQQFGSGGSTRVTTYGGQVTLSTSWERHSVNIAVPSMSGKTIGTGSYLSLNLWTSAGTDFNARTNSLGIQSTTIDFWGVQVEPGTVATPFEQRPIGTELALCQRYYYRTGGSAFGPLGMASTQSSTAGRLHVNLPVQMRIAPTAIGTYGTAFGSSLGTLSSITFDRSTTTQLMLSVAGTSWTAGGSLSVYGSGDATSFLDVSAEL